MRIALMLLAAAAAALAAAGAASAASVEVKDAVARVTVIPENRTDVKVEFIAANPAPAAGGPHLRRPHHRRRRPRPPHPRLPRLAASNVRVGVRGVGEVGLEATCRRW